MGVWGVDGVQSVMSLLRLINCEGLNLCPAVDRYHRSLECLLGVRLRRVGCSAHAHVAQSGANWVLRCLLLLL